MRVGTNVEYSIEEISSETINDLIDKGIRFSLKVEDTREETDDYDGDI